MVGTVLSFSLMAVAGRELSHKLGTFEILFFRSLIGTALLLLLVVLQPGVSVASRRLGAHVVRNCAHYIGQYAWIYGIGYISLTEVFAIEFTAPIWTAIIAVFLLGERMTLRKLLAIGLAMVGMLLILRPGLTLLHPASLVVLLGAGAYGLAHAMTKKLSWSESPLSILFYMCVTQLTLGLYPTVLQWVTPHGIQWLWLGTIAITALTGHYCMVRAFQVAEATVVVPMDFVRLPIIGIVGFLIYNEAIDGFIALGALLIFVGNFLNLRTASPALRQPS